MSNQHQSSYATAFGADPFHSIPHANQQINLSSWGSSAAAAAAASNTPERRGRRSFHPTSSFPSIGNFTQTHSAGLMVGSSFQSNVHLDSPSQSGAHAIDRVASHGFNVGSTSMGHHHFHPLNPMSASKLKNVYLNAEDGDTTDGDTPVSGIKEAKDRNKEKFDYSTLELSGSIRNIALTVFHPRMSFLKTLVVANNSLTKIPPAIRNLSNLEHLNIAHNRIKQLPPEIGDLVVLKDFIANGNLIRSLPPEMGRLFKLTTLELGGNPLSPETVALLGEGLAHLLAQLQNSLDVDAVPPPARDWLQVKIPEPEEFRDNGTQFGRTTIPLRVLCYNILCSSYCSRNLYGYCPGWALKWDYRVRGIVMELRACTGDILCLQEMATEAFEGTFLPDLRSVGYDGTFSAKTRARTMSIGERASVDGCAIFWKMEKFELQTTKLVEFNQRAMSHACGNPNMLNRVMTKDNIAQLVLLRVNQDWFSQRRKRKEKRNERRRQQNSGNNGVLGENKTGFEEPMFEITDDEDENDDLGLDEMVPEELLPYVIVVSVHIHWDPEFSDVKMIQTIMLMREIQMFQEECCKKMLFLDDVDMNAIPILIAGDLNSLPNSSVIEYLRKGKVSFAHPEFLGVDYEGPVRSMQCAEGDMITHGFKLLDIYEAAGSPMPFTNFTFDFKGNIDYILASDSLHVGGVLGPIAPNWICEQRVVGFPHPHVPSDHLPLMCSLRMPLLDKLCPQAVKNLQQNKNKKIKTEADAAAAGVIEKDASSGSSSSSTSASPTTTESSSNEEKERERISPLMGENFLSSYYSAVIEHTANAYVPTPEELSNDSFYEKFGIDFRTSVRSPLFNPQTPDSGLSPGLLQQDGSCTFRYPALNANLEQYLALNNCTNSEEEYDYDG